MQAELEFSLRESSIPQRVGPGKLKSLEEIVHKGFMCGLFEADIFREFAHPRLAALAWGY